MNNDNEGYSKLKHIINENVKAVLLENKQVISIAYIALLQTLKSDPELVKLVYDMPNVNTGYKDNNTNNITNYIEADKDILLDLTKWKN